jgi:hypothetical protein
MTLLESFKLQQLQILDETGFAGIPIVLDEIGQSNFEYDKAILANLRLEATESLAALQSTTFVIRVKSFIGTITCSPVKSIRYNLPVKPGFFIGRKEKLKELHKSLTDPSVRKNILLASGIGGMGKTTLIQEYLHQDNCQAYFNSIAAITVDKNLQSAFIAGMAAALGLSGPSFPLLQHEQLRVVLQEMRKQEGDKLLVIDNINEYDFDDLVNMRGHLENSGWKILIGTRTVPDGFDYIKVNELDMKEASLLFAHFYAPDQVDTNNNKALWDYIKTADIQQEIEQVLDHIVRHTLLTELLAKAGKKRGLAVPALFSFLQEQDFRHPELQTLVEIGHHADSKTEAQQKTRKIHSYLSSIFETDYLLEKTGNQARDAENEAKVTMLRFFSVLPSEDIPIDHLKKLWRVEKGEDLEFETRLDELKQIGWIQGKQRTIADESLSLNLYYKMHPLVQQVVFEKLKPDKDNIRPLIKSITDILGRALTYPQVFQRYAKSVIDKLNLLHGN